MDAGDLLGSLMGGSVRRERRTSTPELIASQLREAIVGGAIRAGTQLRQSEVAAAFGTSVIPVREALRQLEAEGFVVLHHNRGAIVPKTSAEEIEELFAVRLALEPMLIRIAVPKLTDEDFSKARGFLESFDQEPDINRWAYWNWLFHEALYAPSHRKRTLAILANLHGHIDRVLRLQMALEGGKEKADREHRAILKACRMKDADKAATLLEAHIRSVAKIVIKFASSLGGDDRRAQFTKPTKVGRSSG